MSKHSVPLFPLEVRNEILTYTDDKNNHAMINAIDADTEVVILAGGKGCGKSFTFPCVAVYNMLQDKNYNCVMCRNLKIDIKNTIKATLEQFLSFLKVRYNIDLLRHFDILADEAIFKPTGQKIYFDNFQRPGAFAGFTLPSPDAYIGDVFLDEIMQKRTNFGGVFRSENEINEFYTRQKEDMVLLKASTIYRKKNETGKRRHLYMSMNLWEPDHWVIHDYFDHVMPLGSQNYKELEEKHFIFKQSKEYNCTILRLSTFYVPRENIDPATLENIEKLKRENYPLYVASVLGDAYVEPELNNDYFLDEYIYVGKTKRIRREWFIEKLPTIDEIALVVDGYDPGLRDQNGLVRLLLLYDGSIVVINAKAYDINKNAKFKRRDMCRFILQRIQQQNAILPFPYTMLAVDSKEDVVMEMLNEEILRGGLNVVLTKAIKNKNRVFSFDFNIHNRIRFLKYIFRQKLIKFHPLAKNLIDCLGKMVIEGNVRNEKINPRIYDIINAFEYALSIVYKRVLVMNGASEYELS